MPEFETFVADSQPVPFDLQLFGFTFPMAALTPDIEGTAPVIGLPGGARLSHLSWAKGHLQGHPELV